MVAASLADISTVPTPTDDKAPVPEPVSQADITTDIKGPEDQSNHIAQYDAPLMCSTTLSSEESRDDGDEANDTQSSQTSSNATLLTPLSLDLDLRLEPDHWKGTRLLKLLFCFE
jgi:hypothetical protein